MRRTNNKLSASMIAFYLIGLVPVIWFSLRSAPFFIDNGLVGIFENANAIFNDPFHITLVKGSLKVALVFSVIINAFATKTSRCFTLGKVFIMNTFLMVETKSLFETGVDPVPVLGVIDTSATVFKLTSPNSGRLFSE